MAISKDLLDILVCPETKQDLTLADQAMIDKLNSRIKAGSLKNRAGEEIREIVNGALIRKDNRYLYMIREDIPIMLIDEAVPMDQIV